MGKFTVTLILFFFVPKFCLGTLSSTHIINMNKKSKRRVRGAHHSIHKYEVSSNEINLFTKLTVRRTHPTLT